MNRAPKFLAAAFLLIAGGFLASASAGDKDKTPLEGTWKGGDGGSAFTLTINGSKWTLKITDEGDHFASGTFKMDAKQKPSTMDLTITEAGGKADKFKGLVSKAIYELEGDKLKWSAGEPGKDERPTEFAKGKGLFIELQREKK